MFDHICWMWKTYSNDFDGLYSYIVDNRIGSSAFYINLENYSSDVYKAYMHAGDDCIEVWFFSFYYTDETKKELGSSNMLIIKYDGSRYADYSYNATYHSLGGYKHYSEGIFTVGDYNGYPSNIKLTPSKTNMSNQPTSTVSLLTTVLRSFLHSNDFTLDALGFSKYK